MLIANQQNVYIAFCILLFDKKVITMEFVAKVIKFGRVTIPQEIKPPRRLGDFEQKQEVEA